MNQADGQLYVDIDIIRFTYRVGLARARELCHEYQLDLIPGIAQMLQDNPLEAANSSKHSLLVVSCRET